MRSGTISRRELRQRRPARPPVGYLPLLGVLVLGLMVLVWVAGRFTLSIDTAAAPSSPSAAVGPTPSQTLQPVATPSRPPSPSPSPTYTLGPSLSPTVTLSPSPVPTPTPTPSPIPTPSPAASPQPTSALLPSPPAYGLLILSPQDGTVVNVGGVLVEGVATPGSPITWDRPLWFDGHTTADANGYWSFVIGLNPGANVLTFRVGDDRATAQTITVTYQP